MGAVQLALLPEMAHPVSRSYARPKDDWYPTPRWVVEALLRRRGEVFSGARLLDPGAGLGALSRVVEEEMRRQRRELPRITAVEFHAGRFSRLPAHWEKHEADFPSWARSFPRAADRFDVGLMNPPFSVGGESVWTSWVDSALPLVRGSLFVLGQILLLGGVDRSRWWDGLEVPFHFWFLPSRPVFRRSKGSSGPKAPFMWVEFRTAGQAEGLPPRAWLRGES